MELTICFDYHLITWVFLPKLSRPAKSSKTPAKKDKTMTYCGPKLVEYDCTIIAITAVGAIVISFTEPKRAYMIGPAKALYKPYSNNPFKKVKDSIIPLVSNMIKHFNYPVVLPLLQHTQSIAGWKLTFV